jgi:hypothetical protein
MFFLLPEFFVALNYYDFLNISEKFTRSHFLRIYDIHVVYFSIQIIYLHFIDIEYYRFFYHKKTLFYCTNKKYLKNFIYTTLYLPY